jgi:hypothetical protein
MREKKVWGLVVKDFIFYWSQNFPALKTPRQCSLVLLVEVRLRAGKALGGKEVKFVTSRKKEFSGGP